MYKYIRARYNEEIEDEYETLDKALEHGFGDLIADPEYGAWPLDILQDGVVLWSNRGGSPLRHGTCPLSDRIYQYAEANGLDDE